MQSEISPLLQFHLRNGGNSGENVYSLNGLWRMDKGEMLIYFEKNTPVRPRQCVKNPLTILFNLVKWPCFSD